MDETAFNLHNKQVSELVVGRWFVGSLVRWFVRSFVRCPFHSQRILRSLHKTDERRTTNDRQGSHTDVTQQQQSKTVLCGKQEGKERREQRRRHNNSSGNKNVGT